MTVPFFFAPQGPAHGIANAIHLTKDSEARAVHRQQDLHVPEQTCCQSVIVAHPVYIEVQQG